MTFECGLTKITFTQSTFLRLRPQTLVLQSVSLKSSSTTFAVTEKAEILHVILPKVVTVGIFLRALFTKVQRTKTQFTRRVFMGWIFLPKKLQQAIFFNWHLAERIGFPITSCLLSAASNRRRLNVRFIGRSVWATQYIHQWPVSYTAL